MTIPDEVVERWRREARRSLATADADLVEEVAQHVAERWCAARAAGQSPEAADAAALADLDEWKGRPIPTDTDVAPDRWRGATAGLGLDLAAAWRALVARPMATLGAALVVAIATTAGVAVFEVAYGVAWRPLPYPDSHRLVTVWESVRGATGQIAYPDYASVRDAGAFDASGAFMSGVGTLMAEGIADRVNALQVEPAVLTMLGARPAVGRLLVAADHQARQIAISHRLWQSRFGGAPSVIGRTVQLSGQLYTIAGVLEAGFDFELPVTDDFTIARIDVWMAFDRTSSFVTRRDVSTYQVLARLAPAVTPDRAQAIADAIASSLQAQFPETNRDRHFLVVPLDARITGRAFRPLQLAAAGAVLAILIALANLATLSIGRAAARQAEFDVRRSLGASPWALARLLIAEQAMITLAGGAVGVLAGAWLAGAMASAEAARLPRPDAIAVDALVVAFAGALLIALCAVPTVVSLLVVHRRSGVRTGDRLVGRMTRRMRRGMVAIEVATALVLCTAAALLSLTLARLLSADRGFEAGAALGMRVSAYATRYPDQATTTAFFSELAQRLRHLPGVAAAGASSSLPLSGQTTGTNLMAADEPRPASDRLQAGWQTVAPGYFGALGMRVVLGRDVTPEDLAREAHVTVLNETAARALFGSADPVGRKVAVGGGDATGDWHEVIGVVRDVRHMTLAEAPTPRVYDAFGQHWSRTMYVALRGAPGLELTSLAPAARRVVAELDPDAPVFEVAALDQLVSRSTGAPRLAALLAGGLAVISILLALVGTVAIVTCSISERARELGVRLALGASAAHIVRLVVGEALGVTAIGSAGGIAAALAAVHLLRGQLFGARTTDGVLLIAGLTLAMAIATIVAAWWPARRASAADPLRSMRAAGE